MAATKYGRSSGSYWYVGSSSLTAYPSPSGTRKRPWPVSTTASLCGSNRRASRQVTRCAPRWPSGRAARTTARRIPSCTRACTPPRTSYTRRHGRGPRRMRSSRIPRGSGKDRGTVLGLHHRRSNDNECGHPTVNPQLLAQIRSSSHRLPTRGRLGDRLCVEGPTALVAGHRRIRLIEFKVGRGGVEEQQVDL